MAPQMQHVASLRTKYIPYLIATMRRGMFCLMEPDVITRSYRSREGD